MAASGLTRFLFRSRDLTDLICHGPKDHNGVCGLPEAQAQSLFGQILAGMRHMHAHGVCVRAFTASNVMIAPDGARQPRTRPAPHKRPRT